MRQFKSIVYSLLCASVDIKIIKHNFIRYKADTEKGFYEFMFVNPLRN